MSHTPYITGKNQLKNPPTYGSGGTTGAATSTSNVYGASCHTTSSTVNNSYGPAPTAPVTTSNYNPYQQVSTGTPMSTISSNNPYAAAPSGPVTKNYNPYENIAVAPTNSTTMMATASSPYGTSSLPSATSALTMSALPNFSKALDVPPSTNLASYGNSNSASTSKYDSSAVVATAYPVTDGGHGTGIQVVNSMTYQGGRTNGLVSEGNPVKCHKIDYEIKGHEMQLVEYVLKSTKCRDFVSTVCRFVISSSTFSL